MLGEIEEIHPLDRFIEQLKANKYAHSYIWWYKGDLTSVVNAFHQRLSQVMKRSNLHNHPDFLQIETEQAVYKEDELRGLFSFIQNSPLEAKFKILCLPQLEALPKTLANKILKTLEEPPAFMQFHLFCPIGTDVLKTIVSRSVQYSFPTHSTNTQIIPPGLEQAWELYVKEEKIHQLIEEFLKHKQAQKFFLCKLLDNLRSDSYITLQKIGEILKDLKKHQNMHIQSSALYIPLFYYLKKAQCSVN